MSEHALVIIALVASTLNAVSSLARTWWQWEKRRDWVRRQQEGGR